MVRFRKRSILETAESVKKVHIVSCSLSSLYISLTISFDNLVKRYNPYMHVQLAHYCAFCNCSYIIALVGRMMKWAPARNSGFIKALLDSGFIKALLDDGCRELFMYTVQHWLQWIDDRHCLPLPRGRNMVMKSHGQG